MNPAGPMIQDCDDNVPDPAEAMKSIIGHAGQAENRNGGRDLFRGVCYAERLSRARTNHSAQRAEFVPAEPRKLRTNVNERTLGSLRAAAGPTGRKCARRGFQCFLMTTDCSLIT